jgi:hypothetical protein
MNRHTARQNAIHAFHPARGLYGTTYQTADGKTYVRTPWGIRELDAAVGPTIHEAQRIFARATAMRRFVHAVAFVVGLVLGIVGSSLIR